MDPRFRSAIAWLVPLVALAAVVGWETDWGRALEPAPDVPTRVAPQPVKVALLPEFKLDGGPDARRETVDRTLFNPTRRPAPPAPAAAAAAPSMQKGQFTLTGTTVVDGRATAFLREVNGGKPRRVQKGETVNGMLVEDVRPDRVRLTMNGDAEDLTMKVASGPRSTIQPVQPGTPATAAAPAAGQPGQPGQPGQGAAVAQGQPNVTPEVAELLAQRRRAARAAEAAAVANANNQAASAPTTNTPVTAAGAQPGATAQSTPGAATRGPDGNWSSVYQRMMQPRK